MTQVGRHLILYTLLTISVTLQPFFWHFHRLPSRSCLTHANHYLKVIYFDIGVISPSFALSVSTTKSDTRSYSCMYTNPHWWAWAGTDIDTEAHRHRRIYTSTHRHTLSHITGEVKNTLPLPNACLTESFLWAPWNKSTTVSPLLMLAWCWMVVSRQVKLMLCQTGKEVQVTADVWGNVRGLWSKKTRG